MLPKLPYAPMRSLADIISTIRLAVELGYVVKAEYHGHGAYQVFALDGVHMTGIGMVDDGGICEIRAVLAE